MCLGIPLKIISKDGNNATGELNGIKRKVRIDFIPDINIGEFVLVHAGFAMQRMDENSVNETVDSFMEIEDLMKAERN